MSGHYAITELIHVDNFSMFRCSLSVMGPEPAKSPSSLESQSIRSWRVGVYLQIAKNAGVAFLLPQDIIASSHDDTLNRP